MRQKKIKHLDLDVLKSMMVLIDIEKYDIKENTFLEVGSGKGQFIAALARDFKNHHYIAVESNMSVCYRIVEKKQDLQLDNLDIILDDAKHLIDYMPPHLIKGIYLNFSDPWPKAKHHKRRLTFSTFLKQYGYLLHSEGFIQFRTDHESFFFDSVEYFKSFFYDIEIVNPLPESPYMTEYEEKKRLFGPIYQLTARRFKYEHKTI